MTRVAVTRMREGDADDDACPAEPATDFYLPACVFYTAQCARARAECGRTVASWGRWLDVREVAQRRGARSSPLVVRVLWMLADFSLTM